MEKPAGENKIIAGFSCVRLGTGFVLNVYFRG